jgi:acetylornithine deacetylase/succinyl-diaminopimelate desuccinylase-like protein
MPGDQDRDLSRRQFVQGTVSGLALGLAPAAVLAAGGERDAEKAAVLAQVPKMHKAVAKIDMRLVPDMTADDTLAKLQAHLAKHGFADIELTSSLA